jgi:hypothetical protein
MKCATANLVAFAMLASFFYGVSHMHLISTNFSQQTTVHVDDGVRNLRITFNLYELLFF